MPIDLYQDGVFIGSVVRGTGAVYVYGPDGTVLGQMASLDAAAAALVARMQVESAHAAEAA